MRAASTSKRASRRDFLKTSAVTASGAALAGLAAPVGAYAQGNDTIKIGMIGAGGRCTGAAMDAMNADPGVKLVAVCDMFMDRARNARNHLKKQKPEQVEVPDDRCFDGFDGYKEVLKHVDAVCIANAAKFHPLHTKAAIEAGKHVFVEKPHAIDPYGIKMLEAALKLAAEKKLCVVSGLQSRFEPGYKETMQRIHDGAIGDIVAIEENFLRGPYGLYRRAPGLTEVQYQCSNQYHFTWLSGDDVPQSLVHNIDRSLWAMKEVPPAACHGLGGRSSMTDEIYGDVFDHHSVVYVYPSGVRIYAFCRTTTGCYNEVSSLLLGTKGRANLLACTIDGETKWRYAGPKPSPYVEEHKALFGAIRKGEPISSGYHMARSTLVTIMGQISCYTGKEVKWDEVVKSDFFYPPKPEDCKNDMEPPTKPGPTGSYPVYIPGQTKLL
ncbi:MAG TPA: Gfo/Idh/MocA family oxidoreductase [Planctomycetota bacterium]|nr:Gfo/Idh/MocA family oxidoreductase [Planctomycetota bacterium]HRR82244.1 Gfo/Idh/MocA family oxidoreductase [Planctomycetota bacterium]HRT95173.1 Gfo/Idh/MocA family oxidoreductase [Planctomycetota bacterium]